MSVVITKEIASQLEKFNLINPSIILRESDMIITKSVNGITYGETTLDTPITEEIKIYDLRQFLRIAKNLLAGGQTVTVTNKGAEIVLSNSRAKVMMASGTEDAIITPKRRLTMPPANLSFRVEQSDFDQIKSICGTVGADTIAITNIGHGDNLVVEAFNSEEGVDAVVRYKLDLGEYKTPNQFRFVVRLSNIIGVLDESYNVEIASVGAAGIVKFGGEKSSYVVVCEESSTHDF